MTDQVQTTVSARPTAGRARLPFLLIGGMLFLFLVSACQVAVAEDGTINIRPESTTTAPGNTGQNGAGNTPAGFVSQTGEVDPTTTSPIDPNQVYEWNGVIEWVETDASTRGHFIIDRSCDRWSVIANGDENFAKLKELNGEKGVIWGSISFDNVFGHRAIEARTVFAPGDIRPLVALPQVPCNDTPVPANSIGVNHSEITLHGDLVWRAGGLWIVTDRGNVRLELPDRAFEIFPELDRDLPAVGEDIDLTFSLGEYGVVGMWDLANTGLVIKVRDIKEWPHRTFVRNHCGGGAHHFVVGDPQLAAHGTLVINNGQWILRTKSGAIFVHRNSAAGDSTLIDPETGVTSALASDVLRKHDVVVIGNWKTDGNELHMEADRFVRVKTVCEPPAPPRQPILPGEIAALGTLVFENGQPFLNTPSGRIVLFRQNDVPGTEPQPVDPAFFQDIAPEIPEIMDAAGTVVGEDGTVFTDPNHPDIVHPVRHILVVGKWMLYRDHLAIVVRYARPWPYPHRVDFEPVPVSPIFDYPLPLPEPVPGVLGFPVEPDQHGDRKPVTTVDGVSVNSFIEVATR